MKKRKTTKKRFGIIGIISLIAIAILLSSGILQTIIQETKTVRVTDVDVYTYCEEIDSGDLDFESNKLNDIGSDVSSSDVDVCNGLMLFDLSNSPQEILSSTSSIKSVYLNYYPRNIKDDGGSPDLYFGFINNIEDVNYVPSSDHEIKKMYEVLERASSGGSYGGIDVSHINNHRNFHEDDEGIWVKDSIGTYQVKDEIKQIFSNSISPFLAIAIEGDLDKDDDTYIDIGGGEYSNPPYLEIEYVVETCVPETCSSLGYECGSWDDTCGVEINCGGCYSGKVCDSSAKCVFEYIGVYRLENNQCNFMEILPSERQYNDYDTLTECEEDIEECPTLICYYIENNKCEQGSGCECNEVYPIYDSLSECESYLGGGSEPEECSVSNDCLGNYHIAVPGYWECQSNKCVWVQTGGTGGSEKKSDYGVLIAVAFFVVIFLLVFYIIKKRRSRRRLQ